MVRSFATVILSTVLCLSAASAQGRGDAETALRVAAQKSLSTDPQWLALLHYDRALFTQRSASRASPSPFFISRMGDADPAAELDATVRAFSAPIEDDDSHAICRFPARYRWLSKMLDLKSAGFPLPRCARFTQWYDAVNPQRVTLIFPASFLNNPASAFGHTFIRLDRREQNEETRLLAYAADYAASTHGEGALLYAIKGIFGGFDGFYSIMPYAKKVEKYSDLENRDIWEYQLNFRTEEVELLTAHLWELREMPLSYFYFDENCSYHILALLDVARPSLGLRYGLRWWVIPVDTIRTLSNQPGLVDQTIFRPSAATKLRARIAAASSQAQLAALAVVRDSAAPTQAVAQIEDKKERAAALDLSYEYLTYERIRARSDSSLDKQRAWDLLAARSALPVADPVQVLKPETLPENGHKTAMAGIGGGRSEDRSYGEFTFRPAFHALTDTLPGYLPGNQIKFFESTVRQTEDRGAELNRFTALDIAALTPDTRFFHPISWRVNLSYQQFNREGVDPRGVGVLSAGGGKTYQLADNLIVYGLFDGAFEYSSNIDREHAIGAGPHAGAVYTPCFWASSELSFSQLHFFTGDSHREQIATLSQRLSLSRDLSVRLEGSYQTAFENSGWTTLIRIERFFTP